MRLDKLLTELGTGSRSEVKKYIRSGLVTVNSRAYDAENLETGLMTWQIAAIAADVVLGVGILALEIVAIKRFRKRLAEEKAAVAVEN